MADYLDLLGVPFRYGGRGPQDYDCYGLLKALYARDGISLPDYQSPTDLGLIAALMGAGQTLWAATDKHPGATVLFRLGRLAAHVGYVLDDYRFVHTWEESHGVVVERLNDWQHRIVGYYNYVGP